MELEVTSDPFSRVNLIRKNIPTSLVAELVVSDQLADLLDLNLDARIRLYYSSDSISLGREFETSFIPFNSITIEMPAEYEEGEVTVIEIE